MYIYIYIYEAGVSIVGACLVGVSSKYEYLLKLILIVLSRVILASIVIEFDSLSPFLPALARF